MVDTEGKSSTIKQDRSPPFPFIGLSKAVDRAQQLFEKAKRFEVRLDDAGKDWGFAPKSSSTFQTVGALLAYGLLEDSGTGENRKVKISEMAWRILEDTRPGVRDGLLAEAALKPKIIAEYADRWKDGRPDDAHCLSQLKFESKFTSDGAAKFLKVYDDTIRFTKGHEADKKPDSEQVSEQPNDEKSTLPIKVGDYVQWTSGGVEQFKQPRKITGISGTYAFVHGSNTGIPMSDLTTVGAPTPTPLGTSPTMGGGPKPLDPASDDGNEISVLLASNRLQITADVDDKGLEKLEQMLAKYKEILKMLQ